MAENFPITDKTEISRLPKRGIYDKDTIYAILDEALFCTIAYSREGQPFQIPRASAGLTTHCTFTEVSEAFICASWQTKSILLASA
jgi:hypothetical protein